jgi:colanic acid/amylovoran biosynthesis glycosyltransferase
MVEKKGITDAVRAVVLAHARGVPIALTIAGDGELRSEVEQLIVAERAGNFVTLLGTVDYADLTKLYYLHHVCLQPSVTATNGDTEGGANMCIIEAMAAGLPIIATHHADTSTTVSEGENAFLADERRPDQLADALVELSRNPDLWQCFSAKGRARTCQLFDAHKQAAELESIYDRIVQSMSPAS